MKWSSPVDRDWASNREIIEEFAMWEQKKEGDASVRETLHYGEKTPNNNFPVYSFTVAASGLLHSFQGTRRDIDKGVFREKGCSNWRKFKWDKQDSWAPLGSMGQTEA